MENNFDDWFKKGNKAEYLHMGASEGHPFQILLIKDGGGVLHLVNSFKGPLYEFLQEHKKNLIKGNTERFLKNTRHYNNVLAVWMDMPWEVDWYKSMLDGKEVHYRKSPDT